MRRLTPRGRLVLASAVGVYLLGWGFGMREAYVVAAGLALACLAALVWVRVGSRPAELVRRLPRERVEGSSLTVRVQVEPEGGLPLPRLRLVEDAGALGVQVTELRRSGFTAMRGELHYADVPRGRYVLGRASLRVDDPFGLARAETPLRRSDVLSVYPRLVPLEALFSEGGLLGGRARRVLLSRVSGYDLHGVRDYQQGESLRAVHWKTSARLRKLMVKEFEDSPRDEAIVVLDAYRGGVEGRAPDSSFEVAVRIAGSLLRRVAVAGQRSGLLVNGSTSTRRRLTSFEQDWPDALDLLAAVQPDGTRALPTLLADSAAIDAGRVWIVTADMTALLAERLAALAAARREVAVAWIDAASWPGAAERPEAEAAHAALVAAGVAVARVRRGDDLATALGGVRERREGRAPARA